MNQWHVGSKALIAASLCAVCLAAAACGEGRSRPNIILVIADDLGYPYAGFMGDSVVQTPHLDRLASEGAVFTHGFNTSSTCRSSLLTLLTGLEPVRYKTRATALRPPGEKPDAGRDIARFDTVPRLLQRAGYRSFQGGKLWEGTYLEAGFSHGTSDGTDAGRRTFERVLLDAGGGVESLRFGRDSLDPLWAFLDQPDDAPFFVWFAPMLPHHPYDAPAQYLEQYEGVALSPSAQAYYANVSRFDARLGELLAELERRGLRENTVIAYVSDNGFEQSPDEDYGPASVGGPRGKASMYELGFRTPIIVSWPGVIESGRRTEALVSTLDLVATLLQIADVTAPADAPGLSLVPYLLTGDPVGRQQVFGHVDVPRDAGRDAKATRWKGNPAAFMRNDAWYFVTRPSLGSVELYEVATDPSQERDLSAEQPDVVDGLTQRISQWYEQMGAGSP